ncbi:MAG: hypothetical protein MZV63_35865 [Marinilabiliales bacterium]|nr:hypothetical protein [Marinilabiliales bacterium]
MRQARFRADSSLIKVDTLEEQLVLEARCSVMWLQDQNLTFIDEIGL